MSNLRKIRRKHGRSGGQVESAERSSPEQIELEMSELEAILERVKSSLTPEEYNKLHGALETLLFLTQELEKNRVSVQRLKQMLFGATTEKTRKVLQQALTAAGVDSGTSDDDNPQPEPPAEKAKGHGRNGVEQYEGAEKVRVAHPSLRGGDTCPRCKKGKVYETARPTCLVRIRGQAPLGATVYELQKLRCNLCGEIFTAPAPPEVGPQKYDAESAAMIALLKYGSGMPFNRLQRLQGSLGIPLPNATQWEILKNCLPVFVPIHEALILAAAQGKVVHNDDTGMKILKFALPEPVDGREPTKSDRKGVFTSGIVSIGEGRRIALFFTGRRHAGENLEEVLKRRAAELAPPIQMCDALSRNLPAELEVILSNCLAHGRRRFVEVAMNFPQECLYVLKIFKAVYQNDAEAKARGFSDQQRLEWHQAHSGPKMDELQEWMTEQIEQHLVEPNSSLGEAIAYMLNHWEALTLFLRRPGAPLDKDYASHCTSLSGL